MKWIDVINAIHNGDIEKVRDCLHENHDINFLYKESASSRMRSLLHIAVAKQQRDMVRFLLSEGKADINVKDSEKMTPIHYAAYALQDRLTTYVVHQEMGVRTEGLSPEIVKDFSETGVFQLLVTYGADLTCKDREDKTPIAIFKGSLSQTIVYDLIEEAKAMHNLIPVSSP